MSANIQVNVRGPQAHQHPQSSNTNNGNCCGLKFDDSYVRYHWTGRLKIIEIISTFLAAILLPTEHYGYPTRFSFFCIIAWVAFGCSLLDMALHLCSLWDKLPYIFRAPEVHMSLCSLAAFGFVLASGLIAALSPHIYGKKGQITAAALFGFASMAFFGVEALLHFLRFRHSEPPFPKPPRSEDFQGVM